MPQEFSTLDRNETAPSSPRPTAATGPAGEHTAEWHSVYVCGRQAAPGRVFLKVEYAGLEGNAQAHKGSIIEDPDLGIAVQFATCADYSMFNETAIPFLSQGKDAGLPVSPCERLEEGPYPSSHGHSRFT